MLTDEGVPFPLLPSVAEIRCAWMKTKPASPKDAFHCLSQRGFSSAVFTLRQKNPRCFPTWAPQSPDLSWTAASSFLVQLVPRMHWPFFFLSPFGALPIAPPVALLGSSARFLYGAPWTRIHANHLRGL